MKRNTFSKAKLPGSKWTALEPVQGEKHFVVLGWVQYALEQKSETLELEAILTRKVYEIDYRQLKNAEKWKMGWL